jgi:hypothetical protein
MVGAMSSQLSFRISRTADREKTCPSRILYGWEWDIAACRRYRSDSSSCTIAGRLKLFCSSSMLSRTGRGRQRRWPGFDQGASNWKFNLSVENTGCSVYRTRSSDQGTKRLKAGTLKRWNAELLTFLPTLFNFTKIQANPPGCRERM